MAFFYDMNQHVTTNNTTVTETLHLRGLTVSSTTAAQETTRIVGVNCWCQGGTAGGGGIRLKTMGTASTAGSTVTPAKKNPSNPAANSTWFSGPSVGGSPTIRISAGFAQTGGTGGYVAIEPSQAMALLVGGGANGNVDVVSIANGTAQPVDFTIDISEG